MSFQHPKIQKQWIQLEVHKNWFVQLFKEHNKLYEKPSEDQWSAFQLAQHLYQIEELILRGLRKYPVANSKQRLGFSSYWRSFLLKISLLLPLKFKAPSLAKVENRAEDWEALLENWNRLRVQLEEEIKAIPVEKLQFAMLKHPRSGFLNVFQTLEFLNDHFIHHKSQALRLVK